MTDLPPPPAWQPKAMLYDIAAEGDDVDLADAPPRHVVGGALPPLDASVIDATVAEGTDAMPTTRLPDAPTTRVVNAPTDNLRALGAAWGHAPRGIADAWRRAFNAPPPVHPEAWKLDRLKPIYETQAALYERIQAAQKEELKPQIERTEQRRQTNIWAAVCLFIFGVVLTLVGLVLFTTWACLALSVAGPAVVYVFGLNGRRAALAEAEARQGASATRQGNAVDASGHAPDDAPPARVELTRETITTALRNADVISDATEITVRPARPMRSNGEPNGWQVRVELPPSVKGGAKKALAAREFIAFAFDREPNCLLMEPVKGKGLSFLMWVAERDPMACAAVLSPLITAERSNIHKPVQIGYDVLGRRVFVRCMDEVHGLMTGGTGSGKSSLAALLVANQTLYPFGATIIIDPQRSGRWGAYRDVATVISGSDPDTQRLAALVLEWVSGPEMDRRAQVFEAYLAEHPLASPEDIVTAEMMGIARLRLCHVLVVIDEAHSVLAWSTPLDPHDEKGRTCGKVINDAVQTGVSRSRRVGINYVLVTQRGSTTNIKGDIRAILNGKACFSVQDDETAEMGLGPGWKAAGMNPVSLSTSDNKGACYLTGEWLEAPAADWVLVKCDHIDITGHRQVAARGRTLKPQWVLDWCPQPVLDTRREARRGERPAPGPVVPAPPLLGHLGLMLAGGGKLHAQALVARMAAEWGEPYLSAEATRQGLDALLAEVPGVRVRCGRFMVNGARGYGLRETDVAMALAEHAAAVDCQLAATGAPGPVPGPETGSDLGHCGDAGNRAREAS